MNVKIQKSNNKKKVAKFSRVVWLSIQVDMAVASPAITSPLGAFSMDLITESLAKLCYC
jgi:hypothetical protein